MLPAALRLGSRAFSSAAGRIAPVKLSTGIVGLDVVPNARDVLTKLYERTLSEVKVMPPEVFYRQSVERFTRYRMEVVAKHQDVRCCAGGGGGQEGRGDIWRQRTDASARSGAPPSAARARARAARPPTPASPTPTSIPSSPLRARAPPADQRHRVRDWLRAGGGAD